VRRRLPSFPPSDLRQHVSSFLHVHRAASIILYALSLHRCSLRHSSADSSCAWRLGRSALFNNIPDFHPLVDMQLRIAWTWKTPNQDSRMRNSSGTVSRRREWPRKSLTGSITALEDTVSQECASHSHIDDALRSYLDLVAGSKGTSRSSEGNKDKSDE
jgi:hypothetical protein